MYTKRLIPIIILTFLITLSYANSKYIIGADKTFQYWAGGDVPEGFKVLNGQYWASSHFTKEYIMFMEIVVPTDIAGYFCEDNNLKRADKYPVLPKDSPKWFLPPKEFEAWLGQQGSQYYINKKTGHIFMYEVQL